MKIHSLTLENLRGFAGKHEIKFTDDHVVAFIGVNGSGKSTVLEAVADGLSHLITPINKANGSTQYRFDRFAVNSKAETASWSVRFSYVGSSKIYEFAQSVHNSVIIFEGPIIAYGEREKDLVNQLSKDIVAENKIVPVLGYYHATSSSLDPDTYSNKGLYPVFSREQAYDNALMANVDFGQITEFYAQVINLENSEKVNNDEAYTSPLAQSFKLGTVKFLNTIQGTEDLHTVQLVRQGFQQLLAYKKRETLLYLNQLSSGERSVIGLVMDLIYRCVLANSHLPDPLHSPGIVLIDEIELHLHPRWQANIIKALTTTFPNIQFIISTHAPLVINQLKDEQLFVLRENVIIPGTELQTTYGMSASDVITQIMGAPSRPPEVRDRLNEIATLLSDPTPDNLSEAQRRLDTLREDISPHDTEFLQLSNLLSIEESAVDL